MREIKFRAWDKRKMKMREVNTVYLNVQVGMAPSDRAMLVDLYEMSRAYHVDRDVEIMQFTGLMDKNGKEIYEGDIVKWDNYTRIVQWDKEEGMFTPNHMQGDVEVIGNIYTSPGLFTDPTAARGQTP
jgi:uncharacterized phage protein (TIGR01671 family)